MFHNERLIVNDIDINPRVFHGVIGIATEAGELVEIVNDNLTNGIEIDPVHVGEESANGDIGWYNAILNDALNLDWEQGLKNNIDKLRVRYPEKYTDECAENRDLASERKELEK